MKEREPANVEAAKVVNAVKLEENQNTRHTKGKETRNTNTEETKQVGLSKLKHGIGASVGMQRN